MERITATEASRNFSKILDRAEHQGDTFIVERNGEPVVEIRPARRGKPLRELLEYLQKESPGPEWRQAMDDILAERERMPYRDKWAEADER